MSFRIATRFAAALLAFALSPAFGQTKINLQTQVKGILPIANTCAATGASSSTFCRGDGVWATPSAGGTLLNWVEAVTSSGVNSSIPVVSFTVTNAATNVDAVIRAKGTGGIAAQIADGTTVGGDKRGRYAVDLQMSRSSSSKVAAGFYSGVLSGRDSRAEGDDSVIAGGNGNAVYGTGAGIGAGISNVAATSGSFIGGGNSNTTTGSSINGVIGGGTGNYLTGQNAFIAGGAQARADIPGQEAAANGAFAAAGDAQRSAYVLRRSTTDATPTELTLYGSTAGSGNRLSVATNQVKGCHGLVSSTTSQAANTAVWEFKVAVANNNGTTALVGTPTVTLLGATAGASGWALAITINNPDHALVITFTGASATTIRSVASVHCSEVTF